MTLWFKSNTYPLHKTLSLPHARIFLWTKDPKMMSSQGKNNLLCSLQELLEIPPVFLQASGRFVHLPLNYSKNKPVKGDWFVLQSVVEHLLAIKGECFLSLCSIFCIITLILFPDQLNLRCKTLSPPVIFLADI